MSVVNGCDVSFWTNESFLKLDYGDGCKLCEYTLKH